VYGRIEQIFLAIGNPSTCDNPTNQNFISKFLLAIGNPSIKYYNTTKI